MTTTFGRGYADAYDTLYADKDYESECDLIESLARRFSVDGDRVLDLGAGTGRHALILAGRGYHVTGVDISPGMVAIARERAAAVGVDRVTFTVGDIRDARVPGGPFDIALLMFAVLGYQRTDEEVIATLRNARAHLRSGGIVLFDVWNGPAVEAIGPSARTKTFVRDDQTIERLASGTIDPNDRICVVDYELVRSKEGIVIATETERHVMRYFTEDEVRAFAAAAGLRVVASGAFPSFDQPIDDSEWNAGYVAIVHDRRHSS